MSPSVAIKFPDDAPIAPPIAFARIGNSNFANKPKARRKYIQVPLPPKDVRNIEQRIQAADEFWHDLWDAHVARRANGEMSDDALMFVRFSCFIHAIIDDKKLCGELLNYFDKKLKSEFADRQVPVNP